LKINLPILKYKKPKLKPIDIIPMEGDRLQIRHEERVFILEGSSVRTILPIVIPHINGELTVNQIVEKTGMEVAIIDHLLTLLDSKYLLEEGDYESYYIDPEELEEKRNYLDFFSIFPCDSLRILAKLKNSKINLIGEGIIIEELFKEFKNMGLAVNYYSREKHKGAIIVKEYDKKFFRKIDNVFSLLAFPYFPIGILEDANEILVQRKTTFLPIYLDHMRGIIGPLVIPGESPCFKCFELRVDSNQSYFREYQSYKAYLKAENKVKFMPSFLQKNMLHLPILETIRILSECDFPTLLGYFIEIDFLTMESVRNIVLKLPRCPVCSPTLEIPTYDHYFLSQ